LARSHWLLGLIWLFTECEWFRRQTIFLTRVCIIRDASKIASDLPKFSDPPGEWILNIRPRF